MHHNLATLLFGVVFSATPASTIATLPAEVTPDENIYVTGVFYNGSFQSGTIAPIKIDTSGNITLADGNTNLGAVEDDVIYFSVTYNVNT